MAEDISMQTDVVRKIPARKFIGKTVVSKTGKKFGDVGDLIFETNTGEIIDLILHNPTKYVRDVTLEKTPEGDYIIPFHTVIAIGDFVVIEEENVL